ncbi:Uu.00g006440.m01.CDS01 [Anthostomella pinea]|uniref:Uu.00g006440.m01.CDS01 n=1 Tax=Anthostomella pinea TaxID=933095 RepID=A0AAI8VKC2_9PEZI|nr:Uu.00g006440.m01.CDS01 [Anthostomella pinea]
MEKFKGISPHKPLRTDVNEIRIVKLLPNVFNAPIECELEHITIDVEADYEALSYCWGDASVTHPIRLNGRVYPITTSLFTGLNYLRLEDRPRRLWVDSLCINQTDLDERSHEVQRMRDIYEKAKEVIIWLGDYHPFTRLYVKRVFDYVTKLATCWEDEEEEALISAWGFDELWHFQTELQDFLKTRQWFQRIWVLQEVSVRPNPWLKNVDITPDLICGHLRLPVVYLRQVQNYWVTQPTTARLSLPSLCPTLDRLRLIWEGHQDLMGQEPHPFANQLVWILSLVAAKFDATDERDTIFATLGLLNAKSIPSQVRPDYTKTASQVLIDCATFLIEDSNFVNIIQYNSMQTTQLPSWVPDWRYNARHPIYAGSETGPGIHSRVLEKGNALEVDIMPFTEISMLGPKFEIINTEEKMFNVWEDFFLDIGECLDGRKLPARGYTNFEEAVWQLLIIFSINFQWLLDPGCFEGVLGDNAPSFIRRHSLDVSARGHSTLEKDFMEDSLKIISESVTNKYVFRCADNSIGIMGQSFAKPQPGDMICSIRGACSEFVLRPLIKGYRIIGRCERTIRTLELTMTEVGLLDWMGTTHLLSVLSELWATADFHRTTIY